MEGGRKIIAWNTWRTGKHNRIMIEVVVRLNGWGRGLRHNCGCAAAIVHKFEIPVKMCACVGDRWIRRCKGRILPCSKKVAWNNVVHTWSSRWSCIMVGVCFYSNLMIEWANTWRISCWILRHKYIAGQSAVRVVGSAEAWRNQMPRVVDYPCWRCRINGWKVRAEIVVAALHDFGRNFCWMLEVWYCDKAVLRQCSNGCSTGAIASLVARFLAQFPNELRMKRAKFKTSLVALPNCVEMQKRRKNGCNLLHNMPSGSMYAFRFNCECITVIRYVADICYVLWFALIL